MYALLHDNYKLHNLALIAIHTFIENHKFCIDTLFFSQDAIRELAENCHDEEVDVGKVRRPCKTI